MSKDFTDFSGDELLKMTTDKKPITVDIVLNIKNPIHPKQFSTTEVIGFDITEYEFAIMDRDSFKDSAVRTEIRMKPVVAKNGKVDQPEKGWDIVDEMERVIAIDLTKHPNRDYLLFRLNNLQCPTDIKFKLTLTSRNAAIKDERIAHLFRQ